MILQIIFFVLFLFFSATSILGYGFLFNNLFLNYKIKNIGEIGLLGFFFIFFISILIHFITTLSPLINFLLLLVGAIASYFYYVRIITEVRKLKYYTYPILLICILSSVTLNTHADYEWYHLPYVNYLTNFKIIFGLVNVSNNYTYGHGWLDILGLFVLPLIGSKGLTALPILFYFFFIIYFLYEYFISKNFSIKFFSASIVFFTFITFNRLKDFGADIQPTFILIILIFFILKSLIIDEKDSFFHKIILFFFYACVLKIGSVIAIPLVIFFLITQYNKISRKLLFEHRKLYFFLGLFFTLVLSKNIITTGCFFYPIPITCFDNDKIIWASPKQNVNERFEFLSAIAKRWKFYSIEEGNITNRYDYYLPMKTGKILSPKSYNEKRLFWLKYFFIDGDVSRIINSILIKLIPFLLVIIFAREKNKTNLSNYKNKKGYYLIIIGMTISTLSWLFMSPQMRYGGYAIIGGSTLFIISFYIIKFYLREFLFNKIFYSLVIISLAYFLFKNLEYSIQDFRYNKFQNFPWPNVEKKIKNIDYIAHIKNGFNLNLVIKTDNDHPNSPKICGNIDMLCLPSGREVCISNIYNLNGYVFIENTDNNCLLQFRENYWQH